MNQNILKILVFSIVLVGQQNSFFINSYARAAFEPSAANQQDSKLVEAVEAFDAFDFATAEQLFQEYLKNNPSSVQAHFCLGVVCFNEGRREKAREHLERAIEINPDTAYSHVAKGLLVMNDNQAQAKEEFRTALNMDPKLTTARYYLAQLISITDPDKAMEEYIRLIKQTPEKRYATLAYDHISMGERKRIRSIFDKEQRRKLARTFYKQGLARGSAGMLSFASAINLDPTLAEAVSMYAYSRGQLARSGISVNMNKIQKQYGQFEDWQFNLAVKLFKKAINMAPELTDALYNLGELFYDHGDFEEAWVLLKEVQRQQPDYKEVRDLLGSIAIKGETLSLEEILMLDEDPLQDDFLIRSEIPNVIHISGNRGTVHVGTWGDGFLVFNGKQWKSFRRDNGTLPGDYITALDTDQKGNVWFGVAKRGGLGSGGSFIWQEYIGLGLAKYDGKSITFYTNKNSDLPSNTIVDVDCWEHKVWLLTGEQPLRNDFGKTTANEPSRLVCFAGNKWKRYDTPEPISLVSIDKNGVVWALAQHSIYNFDALRWTKVRDFDNQRLHWIDHYNEDCFIVFGHPYSGLGGNKVCSFNNGEWSEFEKSPRNIFCLSVDRNGSVWIGSEAGLSLYKDRQWHAYNPENSGLWGGKHIRNRNVNAIYVDSDNTIWVGKTAGFPAPGGLAKFDGRQWTNFQSMMDNDVGTVYEDRPIITSVVHEKENLPRQTPTITVTKPTFKLLQQVENDLKTLEHAVFEFSFDNNGKIPETMEEILSRIKRDFPKDPFNRDCSSVTEQI